MLSAFDPVALNRGAGSSVIASTVRPFSAHFLTGTGTPNWRRFIGHVARRESVNEDAVVTRNSGWRSLKSHMNQRNTRH